MGLRPVEPSKVWKAAIGCLRRLLCERQNWSEIGLGLIMTTVIGCPIGHLR